MTELTKNIIFQYFSGSASPLQKTLIKHWLQDDANKELFYQWLEEWEKESAQFIPDLEMASIKIMNRLDNHSVEAVVTVGEVHPQKYSFFPFRKLWWVAASTILIIGVSLFIFRDNIRYVHYQTHYGEVKEFILTDSSHVILNANSSLLVRRWGFDDGDRKVALTGEAAFNVKHTASNQKFFVTTEGQLNVEVLGTEFSVYSRNNNNQVELKKGSVKVVFKQRQHQPLILKPGDIVKVDVSGTLLLKHQQPESNFIAWKDHRFIFESTSLTDAVHYIQELFGDKIVIGDELLKEKRITGSFKAASSEELLYILTEMYNLEMLKNGDTVILKEKMQTFHQ